MKTLELHYSMIQFLIIINSPTPVEMGGDRSRGAGHFAKVGVSSLFFTIGLISNEHEATLRSSLPRA